MLSDLRNYYSENGTLSTNFHCQFYDQCRQGGIDLIRGKAAYIGVDYENHTLPRILFVSLDPGSDQSFETPLKRTPEGVKAVEENRSWQGFNPLLHWFTTHKFAVLAAQQFNPKLTYADANRIFAHTNCVKCCEDKKNNDMSSAILYRNCRTYMARELDILDPDIIIGQGGEAQKTIEFACKDISFEDQYKKLIDIHERIRVLQINGHPTLYIKFIYPSWRNDRTRKQEKELYPFFFAAIKLFSEFCHI